MKEFWKSWKFWAAVAAVVLVIVGIILYFTVPAFKTVVWEAAAGLLLIVIGIIIGWFLCKRYGVSTKKPEKKHDA